MPADVELQFEVDDNTADDFARLERRVTELARMVRKVNTSQEQSAREQTRLQTQLSRQETARIRQLGQQQSAQARQQIQTDRGIQQEKAQAHREALTRLNIESRERLAAQRREQSREQDIRRARARADADERRRRDRIERDAERRRRDELQHQRALQREYARTERAGGGFERSIALQFAGQSFGDAGFYGRDFLRGAIQEGVQFQALTSGLTTLQGSAEGATSALRELRELAESPGLTFQGATRGFRTLRSFNVETDDAVAILRNFSNAAALAGTDAAQFAEGMRQLGQELGRGRLQQEGLNSLLERFGPIGREIYSELGKSAEDVNNAIARSGETLTQAIIRLSDVQRIGAADASTIANQISNFQNAVDDLRRSIGTALLPQFERLLNASTDIVNKFNELDSETQNTVANLAVGGTIFATVGGFILEMAANFGILSLAFRGTNKRITETNQRLSNLDKWFNQAGKQAQAAGQQTFNFGQSAQQAAKGANAAAGAAQAAAAGAGAASKGAVNFTQAAKGAAGATSRWGGALGALFGTVGGKVGLIAAGIGLVGALAFAIFKLSRRTDEATKSAERFSAALSDVDTLSARRSGIAARIEELERLQAEFRKTRRLTRGRELEELDARLGRGGLDINTERTLRRARETFTQREAELTSLRAEQAILSGTPTTVRDEIQRRLERDRARRIELSTQNIGIRQELSRGEGTFSARQRQDLELELERNSEAYALLNRRIAGNEALLKSLNAEIEKSTAVKKSDTTATLSDTDALAKYRAELLTAQDALTDVRFRAGRRETREGIRQSLEEEIAARNAVRDADIALAQARVKNEVERAARVASIRKAAERDNIASADDAAKRIAAIEANQLKETQRNFGRAIEAYNRYRQEREEGEEATKTVTEGLSTFGDLLEYVGRRSEHFWEGVRQGAEGAADAIGRVSREFQNQAEVESMLRNLGGTRAGLRRDVGPSRDIRRNFLFEQGQRITEAVGGIPDFARPVLQPFLGQSQQVVDRTTGTVINAPRTLDEERSQRRQLQQRQDITQFFEGVGRSAYDQFGSDILLDVLGIGGRRSDQLNDALSDLRNSFKEVSAEIRSDSSLSERERLDELKRLNADYIRDRRSLEKQAEDDRARAWRNWTKTVIADFGLLIYEQLKLQLAARATNAVLNALGRAGIGGGGGGRGGGSAGIGGLGGFGQLLQSLGIGGSAGGGSAAGAGISAGTAGTIGVGLAAAAVTINGLIDPIKDLLNAFGFHNAENDAYAFNQSRRAGRMLLSGQTPSQFGRQSARDLVDNVTAGIAASGVGAGGGGGATVINHVTMRVGTREIQEVFQVGVDLESQNRLAAPGTSRVAQEVQQQRLSNIEVSTEQIASDTSAASAAAIAAQTTADENRSDISRIYAELEKETPLPNPASFFFGRER